jgi:hypothetical protein
MSSFRRPTNTNEGDSVLYGGSDLHVITDMLNGTINGIPPVKFKSANGVGFWDGVLRIKDAANDTRELIIKSPSGLAASRNLTFPVLAVNDTVAALLASQEFFNKTINLSNNIITDTSAVSGEIMVHNGTKFVRLPAGTSVQFLRGDGIWATAPGQGGGEANTMINIGTAGIGVYKQKTGMEFEMKKINGTSGITVTDNTTDNQIDLSVDTAGILLQNLGGTLTVAKGGTGATTLTGILKGNGTSAFTAVTAPTGDILGTTDSQVVTNKTYNTTDNTLTATSMAVGDILKCNGTKFVRLGRGTANQVLKVKSDGTDVEWAADATGGAGSGNSTTLTKNTSTVSIANTSSETDLLNYSIAGNTIGINGVLHLVVQGYYLNNSGSDDGFQIRLKLGGSTIWSDNSGTVTTSADRRPVLVEFYIKNNNSASQQRITGRYTLGNAHTGDQGFSDVSEDEIRGDTPIQAESTLDTTTSKTIQLTIDHADAHTDISFVANLIFLELIAS